MKIFGNKYVRLVTRRWTDDDQQGVSAAVTFPSFPALADMRYRWEQKTYRFARRHPKVQAGELTMLALGQEVELLYDELYAAKSTEAAAEWDAQIIYGHFSEVVEIISMYQQSLKTLRAPDPHEARVKMVVTNFVQQFKDKYQ